MTAEAVAEHLRRPLYAVSAGELGHNASSLEQQLRVILEVRLTCLPVALSLRDGALTVSVRAQLATAWQAVLLIDEVRLAYPPAPAHAD